MISAEFGRHILIGLARFHREIGEFYAHSDVLKFAKAVECKFGQIGRSHRFWEAFG